MKGFTYLEHASDRHTGWETLVVDAVGNVIEFWGFKRNQGRVWAVVFLHGRPMTAAEIQNALSLSKGAVSMITRELERWEVLRRVRAPSSSSWLFEAQTDLKHMVATVLSAREKVFLSRVCADLAEAEARATEEGVDEEILDRIQRMRALAEAMEKALDVFLASASLDLTRVIDILRSSTSTLRDKVRLRLKQGDK